MIRVEDLSGVAPHDSTSYVLVNLASIDCLDMGPNRPVYLTLRSGRRLQISEGSADKIIRLLGGAEE